ncbi:hypothetical protein ACJROX_02215 [Pseudalkalibacillus sp. A8]
MGKQPEFIGKGLKNIGKVPGNIGKRIGMDFRNQKSSLMKNFNAHQMEV